MFLTITKHCVFTSVNESSSNSKNNYCKVYGNKTYRFLMREIGIFTGVGNGFQEAGMAYTSTNGPFLYKTDFHSTHLKKAKHTHTGRPILNISIAKIVLLPLLSVILVTIGHWFAKISSLKYVNFKHRYLFFGKLRKCPSKHKIIYALHKIFLLLLIALLFDLKVPAKTYHNIESKTGVHHELFMGECFASIETTRTSCLKEQCSLYVLSKLKYSKHCWYLQYILLLSGDINLHPGPVQYPCLVCSKAVRKRVFCCNKCGLWVHKKCYIPSNNISNGLSFICKPCENNANISYDNIWHQFPIADDYFSDDKTVPCEKQIDPDFDKSSYTDSYTDNWKVFNKRGLHFIHLNINSVLSKIDELRIIANKSKASVIGITESKLDKTVLDGEINIDGYELVRSDRNRHGGGVACYIRNDISFSVRGDFSNEIENIFLDIFLPKTRPILIGILYRPPDQSGFLDKLSSAISKTSCFDNQEVYILGDLNINLINTQKSHIPNGIKRYREFCSLHGLKQLITSPTRITENSSSLLDHVLTNSTDRVSQSGVVDTSLSDHQLIYCTRKISRIKFNAHKYIRIRSLKNYNQSLFLEKLNEINFPDYSKFETVNDAYSDFVGKVTSVIDQIAPMKEIRVKNNSPDWFDAEIHEEIETRDKLFAKFKKSKKSNDHKNYKKARNKVQHLINKKKKTFVVGKLNENIGKPKELWKSLKSLGLPSKKNTPSSICLENNGTLSFDSKTNAEIFKDFYSNLAGDLLKKLPSPTNKFGIEAVKKYYKNMNLEGESFSFRPTNHADILKLLEDVKTSKSAGIDNLAGKFLKEGASVLASPITDLCNLSISLSSFPDDCKIAKLKPLYKKETKTKPKNYRPISLLPLISKVIEKVIHNQTQNFLNKNRILCSYQSGFRKHYSTDTCLSYLTNKVQTGFEEGLLTGMVLIDLQKAFDTIDHGILLDKMKYLGFSTSTIDWFNSYLTNRSFIVNVGKEYSSPGKLSCGVPQGSILGPLLFLLYVNDMPQAVNSELLLYADDTCLIYTAKDTKTIEEQLNSDFNSLCEWFVDNKLSIHFGEDKTKSILFGTKRHLKNQTDLDIKYGDIKIKQHNKVTYLGCILDSNLSGESMATKVLGLVNGRLKFLYRKQRFLTFSLRRLLCNALIQPHYDYSCSAWYPSLSKRLLKKSKFHKINVFDIV